MNFKEMRQKYGTQQQFAVQLGLSQNTISTWENGGAAPKTKDLKRIADLLGVTVTELLVALEESNSDKH